MATAEHMRTPALLSVLWAAPTSLIGLTLGIVALVSGGGFRRSPSTVEFHGGALRLIPLFTPVQATAMAIGHVILAIDERTLAVCRSHELEHVRQAEAWGPLFLPAYLAASVLAVARGRHYYRDNWFEMDARRREAR